MKQVLIIGFDPAQIPGYDPAPVLAAFKASDQLFEAAKVGYRWCTFGLDPDAALTAIEQCFAANETYDCIIIGGGIRKPDDCVALFEKIVAKLRELAPTTPFAFNTNPTTCLDAALRWI
ncbi:MAG: hypothetical protein QM831_32175 [Kofleriaceae bacterium]